MTRHQFIPYETSKDCEQCKLFPPICSACSILTDTCKECDGRKKIIDHVISQNCDSCNAAKECTYYEKANKILCIQCAARLVREQGTIIDREKHDLSLITSDKDFHNARVMSNKELENGILADDSIPKEEKTFAFHKLLAERIGHLKATIFARSKEIRELEKLNAQDNLNVKIDEKTIRDYGNEVRKEIQETLKQQDALYQPVVPKVVKPRAGASGVKKSPIDRLAESYAAAHKGMTVEEAKKIIEKGMAS